MDQIPQLPENRVSWLTKLRLFLREDREGGIFFLVLLTTPLIFLFYAVENFTTVKLALFVILTCWLLLTLLRRDKVLVRFPVGFRVPFLLFIIGLVLSSVFAVNHGLILAGTYHRFVPSLLFLIPGILFLVLLATYLTEEKFKILIGVSVFCAGVNVVLGLLQRFEIGYYTPLETLVYTRVPGLLGNANFTSMYIAVLVPFILILLQEKLGIRWLGFKILSIFLLLWSLVVYNSRGALLGTMVGLVVILIFEVLRRKKLNVSHIAISFISLLSIGSLSFLFLPQVRPQALSFSEDNVSSRILIWNESARLFFKRPLIGYGFGNFESVYIQHRPQYLGGLDYLYDDAHNVFLHMAVEGGLFTVAGFSLTLMYSIWKGFVVFIRTGNRFLLGSLSGVLVWVTVASFTPVEIANWVLLFLLLAGIWIHIPQHERIFEISPLKKMLAIPAICMMLIVFGMLLSEPVMEYARRSYTANNFKQASQMGAVARMLNPLSPIGETNKIAGDIGLGKPAQGISSAIERVATANPSSFRTVGNAGILYFKLFERTNDKNYLDASLKYLSKAEKLNPQDQIIPTLRATILAGTGKGNEARDLVISNLVLARTHLEDYENWVLLTRLYRDEGDFRKSLFSLEKLYKLHILDYRLKQYVIYVKNSNDIQSINVPITFAPSLLY